MRNIIANLENHAEVLEMEIDSLKEILGALDNKQKREKLKHNIQYQIDTKVENLLAAQMAIKTLKEIK